MDCWVMVDIVHSSIQFNSSSGFIHMANDLYENFHSCTENNKFPFLWKLYSKDLWLHWYTSFSMLIWSLISSIFQISFIHQPLFLPSHLLLYLMFFFFFPFNPFLWPFLLSFFHSTSPHTFFLSSCQKYLWKPFLVTRVFPLFFWNQKRPFVFTSHFQMLGISVDKRWMWYF
jgi:hypothetical protein